MQEYVYLMMAGQYGKIGCSVSPEQRLKMIKYSTCPELPCEPELIHSIPATMARRAEAALHRKFSEQRIEGEWFVLKSADIDWFKRQNDLTLTILAEELDLKDYRPIYAKKGEPTEKVVFSLPCDLVDELREVAEMDHRSASNALVWILKHILPQYRAALETSEDRTRSPRPVWQPNSE